jgi:hypothetical protein
VVANVAPVKGDPLLGQSFLARLPSWSIDNARHTLVLNDEGGPTPAPPILPRGTIAGRWAPSVHSLTTAVLTSTATAGTKTARLAQTGLQSGAVQPKNARSYFASAPENAARSR